MQPEQSDQRTIDQICDQFASLWREGAPCQIEDFASRHAGKIGSLLVDQLICTEWRLWDERDPLDENGRPAAQAWIERFPDRERLIRALEQNANATAATVSDHCWQCGGKRNSDSGGLPTCPRCEAESREFDAQSGPQVDAQVGPQDAIDDTPRTAVSEEQTQTFNASKNSADAATIHFGQGEGHIQTSLPRRRYTIESEVGRGGMGVVFKAIDERLGRSLAIKVMQSAADQSEDGRQRELARFIEEAKLSAQLDHPGLVPVHELEFDDELGAYFTMRLVKGKNLSEVSRLARSQQDGWNLPRVIGVVAQACQAVAYAHSKNVIHRDLKPSNVMVGRFGAVYVMDWGLAKVIGEADRHDVRPQLDFSTGTHTEIRTDRKITEESGAETPLITMDGSVIGTPAYMPPEQAKGLVDEVDKLSDIYSLGAILYHLLTGQSPYVEPGTRVSPRTILGMVIQSPPQRIKRLNPQAPTELVAICEKAMAREKGNRYANSTDLAEDLQAYLDGRVVRAYRTGAVAELKSWVSRNRATALTGMGLFLAIIAGLLGVVAIQRVSSDKIQSAREETRRYLYDGNMQLIQQAWDGGAVFRSRELLDRQLPATGESDLRSLGWYYFNHQCRQSEQSPILTHSDIITTIAISRDESKVASGCNDGRVRLWNTTDGSKRLLPTEHLKNEGSRQFPAVDGLMITPDGSHVVSAGRFGDAFVCATSPQGKSVALDGRVYPWAMTMSSDGKLVIAPSFERTEALLWRLTGNGPVDKAPQKIVLNQTSPGERISGVHFSPDGQSAFLLGSSGLVRQYRIEDLQLIASFGDPSSPDFHQMAVSAVGTRLAICDRTKVVVWDWATGKELGHGEGPADGVTALYFSASGSYVGAPGRSEEGQIGLWRIGDDGLSDLNVEARHPGGIAKMRVAHGHKDRFMTAGHDNVVRVWNFASGSVESTFRGHRNEIYAITSSSSGDLAASGGRDRNIRIWDLNAVPSNTVISVGGGTTWSAAISPNDDFVATASADGNLNLWNAKNAEKLGSLTRPATASEGPRPAHDTSVQYVFFPPWSNGEELLSCGKDGSIRLWSVARREMIGEIKGAHEGGANTVVVDADHTRIISCGDDAIIRVWSVADLRSLSNQAEPLREIGPIGEAAWGLACSPTENLIAGGGKVEGHKILLWDLDSDSPPRELLGHAGFVTHLSFSEDGQTLASSSQDGSARLWNVELGKELPAPQSPLRGHSGDVQNIQFTPDGRSILTASLDRSIRIWDRQTGESKCSLLGHTGGVQFILVSGDGTLVLSTGWDNTTRIWRAPKVD